jgi:hypothetical protein
MQEPIAAVGHYIRAFNRGDARGRRVTVALRKLANGWCIAVSALAKGKL